MKRTARSVWAPRGQRAVHQCWLGDIPAKHPGTVSRLWRDAHLGGSSASCVPTGRLDEPGAHRMEPVVGERRHTVRPTVGQSVPGCSTRRSHDGQYGWLRVGPTGAVDPFDRARTATQALPDAHVTMWRPFDATVLRQSQRPCGDESRWLIRSGDHDAMVRVIARPTVSATVLLDVVEETPRITRRRIMVAGQA
jgi:hypothetical protein